MLLLISETRVKLWTHNNTHWPRVQGLSGSNAVHIAVHTVHIATQSLTLHLPQRTQSEWKHRPNLDMGITVAYPQLQLIMVRHPLIHARDTTCSWQLATYCMCLMLQNWYTWCMSFVLYTYLRSAQSSLCHPVWLHRPECCRPHNVWGSEGVQLLADCNFYNVFCTTITFLELYNTFTVLPFVLVCTHSY